jgi:hypothetical protein
MHLMTSVSFIYNIYTRNYMVLYSACSSIYTPLLAFNWTFRIYLLTVFYQRLKYLNKSSNIEGLAQYWEVRGKCGVNVRWYWG